MKRTIFNLFVLAIMAMASIGAWAQDGTKKVTYTFEGRNGTPIFGLWEKTLGLKASGQIPAGVSVGTITGVEYVEGQDDKNINDVSVGAVLGISILPQYIVRPGQDAVINFNGFRYEVKDVKWTSRTQVPLISNKTRTWLIKWNEKKSSELDMEFDGNTPTDNTGSWEVSYITRPFTPEMNFAGIRSLNIQCLSKQVLHGHAMKDFIIRYWEPEISVTGTTSLGSFSSLDEDKKSQTVTAFFTAHQGAFTNGDIRFSSNNTNVADFADPETGTLTIKGNGMATITATVYNKGKAVSKASYQLRVGTSEYFEQVGFNSWEDPSGNVNHNYGQTPTGNYTVTGVSGNTLATFNSGAATNNNHMAIDKVTYNNKIPKYTKLVRKVNLAGSSQKSAIGATCTNFVEISDFGTSDANFGSATYKSGAAGNTEVAITTSKRDQGSALGRTASTSYAVEWPIDNNNPGEMDYIRYLGFAVGSGRGTTWGGLSLSGSVTYSNPSDAFLYTYYSTVTFEANYPSDATGKSGTTAKLVADKTQLNASNNDTKGLAGVTLSKLTPNGYSADNYIFMGWNTKADGSGIAYADKVVWDPYDPTTEGGVGPVKLYAQWKKIVSPTDPDAGETMHVYSFWANGGTITLNGEEVDAAANLFGFGMTAPTKMKALSSTNVEYEITEVARPGYTFQGFVYTDMNTGDETTVYDADGNLVKGTVVIDATGKWLIDDDVYLNAKWAENPSDPATTITVRMDATGGVIPGAVTEFTVIEGSSQNVNITSYTPTKAGHIFAGWYTNAAGNGDGDIQVYNNNGEAVAIDGFDEVGGEQIPRYKALNEDFFNANGRYVGTAAPFNANFTIVAHWIPVNTAIAFNEYSGGNATFKVGSNEAVNIVAGANPAFEEAEWSEATVTRGLKALDNNNKIAWNTVCFPFDIYEYQCERLFSDIREFSGITLDSNGTWVMNFTKVTQIRAGEPCFVKLNVANDGTALYPQSAGEFADAYITKDADLYTIHLKDVVTTRKANTRRMYLNGNKNVEKYLEMVGDLYVHTKLGQDIQDYNAENPDLHVLYLQNNKFYVSGGRYEVNGTEKVVWGNNKGFRCYFIKKGDATNSPLQSAARTRVKLRGFDGWVSTISELTEIISNAHDDADLDEINNIVNSVLEK